MPLVTRIKELGKRNRWMAALDRPAWRWARAIPSTRQESFRCAQSPHPWILTVSPWRIFLELSLVMWLCHRHQGRGVYFSVLTRRRAGSEI